MLYALAVRVEHIDDLVGVEGVRGSEDYQLEVFGQVFQQAAGVLAHVHSCLWMGNEGGMGVQRIFDQMGSEGRLECHRAVLGQGCCGLEFRQDLVLLSFSLLYLYFTFVKLLLNKIQLFTRDLLFIR
jgi:hypothetical protein